MISSVSFQAASFQPSTHPRFAGFSKTAREQFEKGEMDLDTLRDWYTKAVQKILAEYHHTVNYQKNLAADVSSRNQGFLAQQSHLTRLIQLIGLIEDPLVLEAVHKAIDNFKAETFGVDDPVTVAIAQKRHELELWGQNS